MWISCDERTKENSAVTLFYLWVLRAIWWSKVKLHVKLICFFTKFCRRYFTSRLSTHP